MHTHANQPRGWFCIRCPRHDGPCALEPRWWLRILDRLDIIRVGR